MKAVANVILKGLSQFSVSVRGGYIDNTQKTTEKHLNLQKFYLPAYLSQERVVHTLCACQDR